MGTPFTRVNDAPKNVIAGFTRQMKKDQTIIKAHVKQHERKTKSGKIVAIHEYEKHLAKNGYEKVHDDGNKERRYKKKKHGVIVNETGFVTHVKLNDYTGTAPSVENWRVERGSTKKDLIKNHKEVVEQHFKKSVDDNDIEKSQIKAHTMKTKTGKVANVKAHSDKRTKKMQQKNSKVPPGQRMKESKSRNVPDQEEQETQQQSMHEHIDKEKKDLDYMLKNYTHIIDPKKAAARLKQLKDAKRKIEDIGDSVKFDKDKEDLPEGHKRVSFIVKPKEKKDKKKTKEGKVDHKEIKKKISGLRDQIDDLFFDKDGEQKEESFDFDQKDVKKHLEKKGYKVFYPYEEATGGEINSGKKFKGDFAVSTSEGLVEYYKDGKRVASIDDGSSGYQKGDGKSFDFDEDKHSLIIRGKGI